MQRNNDIREVTLNSRLRTLYERLFKNTSKDLFEDVANLNLFIAYILNVTAKETETDKEQIAVLLKQLLEQRIKNMGDAVEMQLRNHEYNDLFFVQGALRSSEALTTPPFNKEHQKQFYETLLNRLASTEYKSIEMQPYREVFEQNISKLIAVSEKHSLAEKTAFEDHKKELASLKNSNNLLLTEQHRLNTKIKALESYINSKENLQQEHFPQNQADPKDIELPRSKRNVPMTVSKNEWELIEDILMETGDYIP